MDILLLIIFCVLLASIIALIFKDIKRVVLGFVPMILYAFSNLILFIPPLIDIIPFGISFALLLALVNKHINDAIIITFCIFILLLAARMIRKFGNHQACKSRRNNKRYR